MTHQERLQRRKRIADDARLGFTASELVEKYKVSRPTVYQSVKEYNVKLTRPQAHNFGDTKYDWNSVDWTQQNSIIAKKLGCSTEVVRQRRKIPSIFKHRQNQFYKLLNLVKGNPDITTMLPDFRIARLTKSTVGKIKEVRELLGIKRQKGTAQKIFPVDLVNWKLPNADLAEIWGYHPIAVAQRRNGRPKRWVRTAGHKNTSPEYLAALDAERIKAKEWKERRNNYEQIVTLLIAGT